MIYEILGILDYCRRQKYGFIFLTTETRICCTTTHDTSLESIFYRTFAIEIVLIYEILEILDYFRRYKKSNETTGTK